MAAHSHNALESRAVEVYTVVHSCSSAHSFMACSGVTRCPTLQVQYAKRGLHSGRQLSQVYKASQACCLPVMYHAALKHIIGRHSKALMKSGKAYSSP